MARHSAPHCFWRDAATATTGGVVAAGEGAGAAGAAAAAPTDVTAGAAGAFTGADVAGVSA